MHHVAIMNKSWKLIPKIYSGEKTIESRWYQTKRTPWNRVHVGDTIFFKNSGEEVTLTAEVSKVLQFSFQSVVEIEEVIKKYGKEIALVNSDPSSWGKFPKYCILMWLKNPQEVKFPFSINKDGFGTGAAWITVEDIEKIRLK